MLNHSRKNLLLLQRTAMIDWGAHRPQPLVSPRKLSLPTTPTFSQARIRGADEGRWLQSSPIIHPSVMLISKYLHAASCLPKWVSPLWPTLVVLSWMTPGRRQEAVRRGCSCRQGLQCRSLLIILLQSFFLFLVTLIAPFTSSDKGFIHDFVSHFKSTVGVMLQWWPGCCDSTL